MQPTYAVASPHWHCSVPNRLRKRFHLGYVRANGKVADDGQEEPLLVVENMLGELIVQRRMNCCWVRDSANWNEGHAPNRSLWLFSFGDSHWEEDGHLK